METNDLENLRNYLDDDLINKLKKKNIEKLFPVQKVLIPYLTKQLHNINFTKPHDVCVNSPTGSGKTFTFALPIIQYLKQFCTNELRVLIVLPVTDLAEQVHIVFKELCEGLHINIATAIGNKSIETDMLTIFHQTKKNQLINKADIMIATPGKLLDLIIKVEEFSLKNIKVLVIDEVDRILNSELEYNWINTLELSLYDRSQPINCNCLLKKLEKTKYNQFNGCCLSNYSSNKHIIKLLFSATLNNEKVKLESLSLFEPLFFNFSTEKAINNQYVGYELPKTLTQRFIIVENDFKPAMIIYMLKNLKYRKILCFMNNKQDVHRLNLLLKKYKEFKVYELSSQINSEERNILKTNFSNNLIDLIICSDILARGIDLEDVNYVVNYEPPLNIQTYIHRIGRTARGRKLGTAITLVDASEKSKIIILNRKIESSRKIHIRQLEYNQKTFKEICLSYTKLLDDLKLDIEKEIRKKKSQRLNIVHKVK